MKCGNLPKCKANTKVEANSYSNELASMYLKISFLSQKHYLSSILALFQHFFKSPNILEPGNNMIGKKVLLYLLNTYTYAWYNNKILIISCFGIINQSHWQSFITFGFTKLNISSHVSW